MISTLLALLLSVFTVHLNEAVVQSTTQPAVVMRPMSHGFMRGRKTNINTIVIHSSYNPQGGDPYSVESLVAVYHSHNVSAHYLIDRRGTIYQLVQEGDVSYHAGRSQMPDGRRNVNEFSIGIELMNMPQDSYTKAQYRSLRFLNADIQTRHPIENITGHDVVAPDRKSDPWNFDWKCLELVVEERPSHCG